MKTLVAFVAATALLVAGVAFAHYPGHRGYDRPYNTDRDYHYCGGGPHHYGWWDMMFGGDQGVYNKKDKSRWADPNYNYNKK